MKLRIYQKLALLSLLIALIFTVFSLKNLAIGFAYFAMFLAACDLVIQFTKEN